MSEKITFRELIESIAEETDNTQQFTHDFLKDFVDVINDGLEQDRKVSIAGFGKFKLRRMDERKGYNPQSGEKITIPEHNKIVFKPYKDLRELVNAPYAHLEPELIKEESTSADKGNTSENVEQQASGSEEEKPVEQGNEDDFIPTAPPTAHQPKEEKEKEISSESEEAPFNFDDDNQNEAADQKEESLSPPYVSGDENADAEDDKENIDQDIVEFNAQSDHNNTEEKEQPEDDLSEFMGAFDQSEEENTDFEKDEELKGETSKESEEDLDPFAEGFGVDDEELESVQQDESDASEEDPIVEQTRDQADKPSHESEETLDSMEKEKKEEPAATPSSRNNGSTRKRSSAFPAVAAAALILVVLAAGVWYYTGSISSTDSPEMVIDEPTSNAVAQKDNQEEPVNQEAEASETENQDQSQETKAASGNASQESDNNAELEIEEGQTLWSIAEEKYGNPRLWPWIYGKNGSLKDPDLILAGKSLSVPLPSGPQNTLNYSDSVGVAKGHIATYNWYKSNDSVKAKNHLWAAKSYHDNVRDISDIQIDKADLTYVNQSR